MKDMETIRSELVALKIALSASAELTFDEALARISETAEKAGENALALEEKGQTAQAEVLYEALSQVFETAAQQVPEADRQRMAALGNYWSLKAQMARLAPEPTTEPPAQPVPRIEFDADWEAPHKPYSRLYPVRPHGRVNFGPDAIRVVGRTGTIRDTGELRLTAKISVVRPDLKKPSDLTTSIKIDFPTSPPSGQFEIGRARRRRLSQKRFKSGGVLGDLGNPKKGAP